MDMRGAAERLVRRGQTWLAASSITLGLFFRNGLANHAAAVAYAFLLSLVPLVILVLVVMRTWLANFPELSEAFFRILSGFNPYLNADQLAAFGVFEKSRGGLEIVSVIALLWVSRLVLRAVQRAFSVIFPGGGRRNVILSALASFIAVPGVFGLVVLVVLANLVVRLVSRFGHLVGAPDVIVDRLVLVLDFFVPAGAAFIVIFLAYRFIPVNRPSSVSALKGAALCTVFLLVVQKLFTRIFSATATAQFYGVAGSVVVLLAWVYVAFVLFFLFAEGVRVLERLDVHLFGRVLAVASSPKRRRLFDFIYRPSLLTGRYALGLQQGEVLFDEGDETKSVYIVHEGNIDIIRGEKVIATLGPGSLFGEMAMLMDAPRMAGAAASTDAVVFELSPQMFEDLLQHDAVIARSVIDNLVARLAAADSVPPALKGARLFQTTDDE